MAEVHWLKGELVGNCVGKPHRKVGGSGLARWYKLELVDAVIGNWAPVAGPPASPPEGPAPFCQAKLRDARLRSLSPGGGDEELSLRELSVWDWKMRDQREGGGESRCTLVGTVYAQEVPGTRRPALPADADRLDRWGCLALLLGLLVASWLWWSCGPFTCGLWASVVLASWWAHRARTRRRTPPGLASKILQGVLAFALILGGAGLVLAMYDATRVVACGDVASLYVLASLGVVVAAALLTVSWPRAWIWLVWTAAVVLWCGRSGTDCAALWAQRTKESVVVSKPEQPSVLEALRQRLSGEPAPLPPAAPGAGRADGGAGGSGAGGPGGEGSGAVSPGGDGSGGDGSGGDGSGGDGSGSDGSGNTGPGGEGTGGPGSGSPRSAGPGGEGTGDGAAGPGGMGTGVPKPGQIPGVTFGDEEVLEAASEPRMSVDEALANPAPFLDGSSRITLSGELLFAFDEDQLKPSAETRLRQVAKLLRLDPAQRVLLEGHADTIGGDQYNQELSERRARAVRTWLVEQAHINPLQIDTVGYGNARPIVPASRGPAAQQANRRVEVRVLPVR